MQKRGSSPLFNCQRPSISCLFPIVKATQTILKAAFSGRFFIEFYAAFTMPAILSFLSGVAERIVASRPRRKARISAPSGLLIFSLPS